MTGAGTINKLMPVKTMTESLTIIKSYFKRQLKMMPTDDLAISLSKEENNEINMNCQIHSHLVEVWN